MITCVDITNSDFSISINKVLSIIFTFQVIGKNYVKLVVDVPATTSLETITTNPFII